MSFGGEAEQSLDRNTSKTTEEQLSQQEREFERRERLQIDETGITKMITDVLESNQGLAQIFSGEQTAGVFNSTVATQQAGELAARIAGELAKVTGERIITEDESQESETSREARTDEELRALAAKQEFKL